jgi:MFS family permease
VKEAGLVLGVSIHQLICWGTLYSAVPVFIGPMEAELGWSRAEFSGAVTAGLLTAGIGAIPVGRYVDRHGSRGVMTLGAALGGLALLAWSAIPGSLALFYVLWIGIGAVQALALSDPAYAAITANSRDPRRAVMYSTFITGVTTSIFLPLGGMLVELLGWRQALGAFAALQLVPAMTAAVVLRGTRGRPLRRALRRRAFWALAVTFCAQAFTMVGIGFHILPLLEERGLPQAAALLVVAVHGPCQVLARGVLFLLGRRLPDIRHAGYVAVVLQPLAMLVLALAPPDLAVLLLYSVLLGAATGLLTILRVSGIAEILGREGYGQVSGAITTVTVLPRTAAPLALALVWEMAGGYGAVPWILVGITTIGALAFVVAALDRPPEGSSARAEG